MYQGKHEAVPPVPTAVGRWLAEEKKLTSTLLFRAHGSMSTSIPFTTSQKSERTPRYCCWICTLKAIWYVHWKQYHTYIESSANTMSYLVMLDFNGSMIFVLSHKMHIHSGSVNLLHKRCFSFQTWRSLIPFISHLHERSKGRHSHAIMPFSAGPR